MHSLKITAPFVVETKEHYYKDAKLVHTFKLLQESKTIDHEICFFCKIIYPVKKH